MKHHSIVKAFGLYLAYAGRGGWIGNCFSPAVVVEHPTFNRWVFTLRTNCRETRVYVDGLDVWWNSEHLARWFGTEHETSFGGFWTWCGHTYL